MLIFHLVKPPFCSSTPGPIIFQEYTGPTFKTKKPSDLQINGRLGPLIYAETKDMVKVVFYNRADRNLTLYPHGLRVGKMFEGVLYDDVTGWFRCWNSSV